MHAPGDEPRSDSIRSACRAVEVTSEASVDPGAERAAAGAARISRRENRRWWLKLFLQPLLFLICGAALIAGLGWAQRLGYLVSHSGAPAPAAASGVQYICPMMCTPPQSEPGRCPVCAMELVPTTSGGGSGDGRSVRIASAARRVAGIQTASVVARAITRTIRVIGDVNYDEGKLKTISAYVDGRLERLFADYTGVVVERGDPLALLYSPRLYAGQVELLLARKSRQTLRESTLAPLPESEPDLYAGARQRLQELGMTAEQIEELERGGEAHSRMYLAAPMAGTVIEKLAVEGQYVREGDPIYRLADLTTVWLLLRLFPEDAAAVRYGQKVSAQMQSLPGRDFSGRVAFIDPRVDPRTRTVAVRVVLSNPEGLLRIGDYAAAEIEVPLAEGSPSQIYDPELADKWISPRHPHIIADAPGTCPVCGVDLVPAAQFGFTDQPLPGGEALVVPRDAVLMAGSRSVLYVETEAGRFELRSVVLGPSVGSEIVVLSGVTAGEQVATRGNFLIDSQMQLAGNPSLIDPDRVGAEADAEESAEIEAALASLSEADRALAMAQRICPVSEAPLGAMGRPIAVEVAGRSVFICCESCRAPLLAEPEKYLPRLPPTAGVGAEREAPALRLEDLPAIEEMRPIEPVPGDAGDGRDLGAVRRAEGAQGSSSEDWSHAGSGERPRKRQEAGR